MGLMCPQIMEVRLEFSMNSSSRVSTTALSQLQLLRSVLRLHSRYSENLMADLKYIVGIITSFIRRCLSLGLLEPRCRTWSNPRFFRRLHQLLWMVIRSGLDRVYHVRASHPDVCPVPSGLCDPVVAHLHRPPSDYMDVHRCNDILQ